MLGHERSASMDDDGVRFIQASAPSRTLCLATVFLQLVRFGNPWLPL